MERKQLSHADYTVGWVCALPKELAAASAMLDEEHEDLSLPPNDYNTYYLGRIGVHNIVIAGLPKGETGTNSAATVATRMVATFTSIRFGLLVGVGGGVPSKLHDIRLGDVVVSTPTGQNGGVIQWDFGKTTTDANFERTSVLNRPPAVLMTALSKLEAIHNRQGSKIEQYLSEMVSKYPKLRKKFGTRPSSGDTLFKAEYDHVNEDANCQECDLEHLIEREERDEDEELLVHYGLIASGNQVIKHGKTRDEISTSLGGALCFEMEAAGLLNDYPCLVVRGICDYADSHKNKLWQDYAAATAAAYAKELMMVIPASQVTALRTVDDTMNEAVRLLIENHNIREEAKEDRENLKSLHNTNYEVHKERNPDRLEGTCVWFLEHPNFVEWREKTESSFLWVSADPGCGKSVLCRSLIDHDLKSDDSRTTCYYFFKDDDEDQQSLTKAICALIHQLLSQKRELVKDLANHTYSLDKEKLLNSFPMLWEVFIDIAINPAAGEVICILDALDECAQSQKELLMKKLKELYSYESIGDHNIKFLITSRPEFDIERGFGALARKIPTIHLAGEEENETISREINIVVRAKVKDITIDLDLDDSVSSALEQQLLEMSNRTYLWLKLIWEVIYLRLDATTEKRVRRIVETIPPTLDKAYEEILRRSKDAILAKKLLHMVVCAKRPLSLAEMNIALAIDESSQSYEDLDLEPERLFKRRIRNACGLFVHVVDSRVYLIHQTAKEFLVQAEAENHVPQDSEWKGSLANLESNYILAKACMTYLRFEDFKHEISRIDQEYHSSAVFNFLLFKQNPENSFQVIPFLFRTTETERLTANHAFLEYSANHWLQHFENAAVEESLTHSALDTINPQSDHFFIWFHLFRDGPIEGIQKHKLTDLMVAAYCGATSLVDHFIQSGIDVTAPDNNGKTALIWWLEGRETEFKFHPQHLRSEHMKNRLAPLFSLLRAAATVAISRESQDAHKQRTLMEEDVSLDDEDRKALVRAILRDLVVDLVLHQLANSEDSEVLARPPETFFGAAMCCKMIADQILDAIDIDSADDDSDHHLFIVLGDTVKVDLELHDVPRDIARVTPDDVAVVLHHILHRIHESTAHLNLPLGLKGLRLVSEIGFQIVGTMIVQRGLDDTLYHATITNLPGVMKILLLSGAYPNYRRSRGSSWSGMTLVHAALALRHHEALETLLSYGASPNLPMESYSSGAGEERTLIPPIFVATGGQNLVLLRCLLQYGANPDQRMSGMTPLHTTALNGYVDIAQELLESGADLTSKTDAFEQPGVIPLEMHGYTALHLAAKEGHVQFVELLVQKGFDRTIENITGHTALDIARRKGYMEIIDILERS